MGRLSKTINSGWKFNYFPENEQSKIFMDTGYDDSSWYAVGIPHTWNTYETTGEIHPFIMHPSERDDDYWWYGWGWYRKRFSIDKMHSNKKIFIEFDGVQKYTKVWLNGKYVGEHKGGYTSFYFDITDSVSFSKENILVVQVSNKRNDEFGGIPPVTAGNFNVYGGIYRDVRIVIKERVYIPFQGSAEHEGGTYITTPHVSGDKAYVNVKTYVKNDYSKDVECIVKTVICDENNVVVNEMRQTKLIKPFRLVEYEQESGRIEKPKLWSDENPHLYQVKTYIIHQDTVIDYLESTFGFRWFKWDYKQKRLYLNGKRIHIHGTNRHQEYPWLGDAIPKWMHEMDLKDIRFNLGHNFMRTAHYTQDSLVYDLCDRYGIIVCEEVPVIKHQRFSEKVQKQMVKEMIRRDRNHPSIVMWSMGNETYDAAEPSWAREEDETRIIHVRKAVKRGSDEKHTHEQMDMENLLRCTVRGWYNQDVKNLEPQSGQHAGHEEWQHKNALEKDASIRGRIDINGVMWIYADHGADREYIGTPLKHINPKGWVDAYRIPKYMYYLWQANWSDKPVIFIHPFEWTEKYIGEHRDIIVNSNCDYVELKIDGISLGKKYPDRENDYTVVFRNVLVRRGSLSAEGMKDGRKICHELDIPGEPAKIVLEKSHEYIRADLSQIVLVTVDITDKNGVHIYGADNTIRFKVEGCALPVVPDTFTSDIDRNNAYEGTMYIDTPFNIPIRSNGRCGKIKISAFSKGLTEGKVELEAVPALNRQIPGVSEPELKNCNYNRKMTRTTNQVEFGRNNIFLLDEKGEDIELDKYPENEYEMRLDIELRKLNECKVLDETMYKILKKVLIQYLINNDGKLVADDYNFVINLYNDCVKFCGFLDEIDVGEPFKEQMKEFFATAIVKNRQMPLSNVVYNYLDLPANSILAVYTDGAKELSDVIYAESNDLEEILLKHLKGFKSIDKCMQSEIFRVLKDINPYIKKEKKNGKTRYKLCTDKVILIPPLNYYGKY